MKIDPVVRNMLQINRSGNDRSRQPAVFLSKLINQIMRQPALILTLFLLAAGLQAQKTYIDTLWLKNGTAFTGKIQDYRENKSVAILTRGGVRRKVPYRQIEHIGWSEQSGNFFLGNGTMPQGGAPAVYEVLYLNDGSVLRGRIKEIQRGGKLVFELSQGMEMTFMEDEIKKIVQESYPLPAGQPKIRQKKPYAFEEKGLYFSTTLALGNGRLDDNLAVGLGIDFTTGYQFHRLFGVGANLGLNSYAFFDGTDNFFTPSLELRGYLSKKTTSPYYSILGGYGFPFKNKGDNTIEGNPDVETLKREGGYYFHPSVGVRIGASKGANIVFDLGYAFQSAYFEEVIFNSDLLKRDVNYRRLTLRFGLVF